MVLVSGDPDSIRLGSEEIFMALEKEFKKLGIQDEISLSMISDVDRQDASPLVIVYPEAVIYGPVTVEDIPILVEEHLYKGRIASNLVASSQTFRTDCLVGCQAGYFTRRKKNRPGKSWNYQSRRYSRLHPA